MNEAFEVALRKMAERYAEWCSDEEIGQTLDAFIDWASPRIFPEEPDAARYGRSAGEYVYGSISESDIADLLGGEATAEDMRRNGWDVDVLMDRWVRKIWDVIDDRYIESDALFDALRELGYGIDDLEPEFQDVLACCGDGTTELVVQTKVASYEPWPGERTNVAVAIDGRYEGLDGEERLSLTGLTVERGSAEAPWEVVEEWGPISTLLPQDPPYGCVYVNADLTRAQREALYRGHVLEPTGLTWPFNMETYEIARVCDPDLILDLVKLERGGYETDAAVPGQTCPAVAQ